MKEQPEVMGRFGAVYGIKGWLKVFSETENPENLFTYSPWFYRHKGEEWQEIKVENYRRHSDGFIAKIDGINVREEAQAFTVYPERHCGRLPRFEAHLAETLEFFHGTWQRRLLV